MTSSKPPGDTLKSIAEKMSADYAPGWKPEPMSVLMGTVSSLDLAYSEYNPDGYPVVTIVGENDVATALHCFHSALNARIKELKPSIGERIQVLYKGKQTSKDGKREYQAYVVQMPQRTSEDFWSNQQPQLPTTLAKEDEFNDIPF
jgi:hypothetical protein